MLAPTMVWARIECRFSCPNCGVMSPVNHLDIDGAVGCAHCGLDHALPPAAWQPVLGRIHDTVDLAGVNPWIASAPPGSPLVVENPYQHVGVTVGFREWAEGGVVAGRGALNLRVSPGPPFCSKCGAAVLLEPAGPGQTRSACTACGERGTYALPPGSAQLYPPAVAVIAGQHRTDRAYAQMGASQGGAAVALMCPGCGAPLAPSGASNEVACGHCRTVSLVSGKLWHRLGVAAPKTEPWWVLFQGPSPRRQQLESAAQNPDALAQELAARARAAQQASRAQQQGLAGCNPVVVGVVISAVILAGLVFVVVLMAL